jgi:hypothetical protein
VSEDDKKVWTMDRIEKGYEEIKEIYIEEANAGVHTYEDGMEYVR